MDPLPQDLSRVRWTEALPACVQRTFALPICSNFVNSQLSPARFSSTFWRTLSAVRRPLARGTAPSVDGNPSVTFHVHVLTPDESMARYRGLSSAVTAIPGVVFSGGLDGVLRAFAAGDGNLLWSFNTAQEFDAVNGIERRYEPLHVAAHGPREASRRAAVIQAAYASMLNLFPTQKAALDAQLAASLANLNDNDAEDEDEDAEDCAESIALGLAWGQHVADQIWAWRSTDGFDPSPSTYTGSTLVGKWRPTPPAFANGQNSGKGKRITRRREAALY